MEKNGVSTAKKAISIAKKAAKKEAKAAKKAAKKAEKRERKDIKSAYMKALKKGNTDKMLALIALLLAAAPVVAELIVDKKNSSKE